MSCRSYTIGLMSLHRPRSLLSNETFVQMTVVQIPYHLIPRNYHNTMHYFNPIHGEGGSFWPAFSDIVSHFEMGTHTVLNLFDFSKISKIKFLAKSEFRFFTSPPRRGVLKK